MKPHRLAGAGACLAVLVLATLGLGFGAPPSRGATASTIVFVSDRDAYQPGEIYSLAPGRPPRNITHNPSTDIGLAVSPVGDTIAFWSDRSGRFRIYLARSDGSHLRVVNDLKVRRWTIQRCCRRRSSSLDGRRLFADAYVVDVARRTARHVLPDLHCLRRTPSPDGRSIACYTDFKSVTVYDLAGRVRFAFDSDREPLWSRLGLLVERCGHVHAPRLEHHLRHLRPDCRAVRRHGLWLVARRSNARVRSARRRPDREPSTPLSRQGRRWRFAMRQICGRRPPSRRDRRLGPPGADTGAGRKPVLSPVYKGALNPDTSCRALGRRSCSSRSRPAAKGHP